MIENNHAEIDVEQLMTEVREALAKRDADGHYSLGEEVSELFELLLRTDEAARREAARHGFRLQADFSPRSDDHYHVNDLLQFHDRVFIWNAYLAILKREPDEWGLVRHLQHLRSGRRNKIDLLMSLRYSAEGKSKAVKLEGLLWRGLFRLLYRVPVFGYMLETVVQIARLPATARSQRQFEAHVVAQLERLAQHIDKIAASVSHVAGGSSEQQELREKLKRVENGISSALNRSKRRSDSITRLKSPSNQIQIDK